jgi:hypothetical protein
MMPLRASEDVPPGKARHATPTTSASSAFSDDELTGELNVLGLAP